ncbi:putative gustatory receptor 8a [Lucilia cuprina]|uniref:Putative gustatory receptor 8a n=1 Tax=Lucilia cuprina TaxID=7375 RepID=A0A0L0CJU8_LUCCU|nr:putative gustatory receptor 8a [Lucilia cuprina]
MIIPPSLRLFKLYKTLHTELTKQLNNSYLIFIKLKMSKFLLNHFYIFTIIGYCTITLNDNLRYKIKIERYLILWSWLLLICFNIITIIAIFSPDEFLYRGDAFGYFNDTLKVIFSDIAVTCSYLEAIFRRKPLREFWKIYVSLRKKSPEDDINIFDIKLLWQNGRFIIIFYGVVICEALAMFVFIVWQYKSRHLILFWSIFSPLAYATYIRNMQFIFYIELIRLELVKLQYDLNLMVDYSRFVAYGCGFKGFEEFLRRKLVEKQKQYQMIYEMFENFQNSFGLSIVAVLSMIYVRILVDSYFAYYSVYNNWNKLEVTLLCPSLLEIPVFLITSKNCMDVSLMNYVNMKVCISKILRIHLKIFKIMGFCNLSLNENFKPNINIERCLTLWSLILLVSYNIMAFIALTSDDVYLFTSDKFGYFNDVLKFLVADIAVTVSYLETIFKRSEFYKFWTIYNCLQRKTNDEWKLGKTFRFFAVLYTFIILEAVILILFFNFQTMTRHLTMFWSAFLPFIYAVHLRNMQFIFYIELIRLELVKLKEDLSLLVDYSRFMAYGCGFRGFGEFLRKQLLDKQKNYQMIYEMFEHFQNGFGFSITAVLLMIYVRVLVDAYFAYYTIFRDWNRFGSYVIEIFRNYAFNTSLFTNSGIFNNFKKLHGCGELFLVEVVSDETHLNNVKIAITSNCVTMNSRIPNILRIHMRIFRIVGFCGLSMNDDFKRKINIERWLTLWSIFLLIIFNIVTLVTFLGDDDYLFTNDLFGYFNDILKVVFADIAVTIAYLEAIFKREHYHKFWLIYDRLQTELESKGKSLNLKDLWKNRRFLVIFYTIIIMEIVAIIWFVNFQTTTRHVLLFCIIFTPFTYAVHLRNMQFIFYIEIIRLELVKLQEDLNLLVDYSRFMAYGCTFRGFEEFLRKKLLDKQKTYQMIFEMFEHFQNGFGFSIIAVILMIYVHVLVDAYFAYYAIYCHFDTTEIILFIPACFQIPVFLITSKNCMDVVKLITFNLHSIVSQFENHSSIVSTQLQNFSLQILHQRICINGIGITRMDGYMLTRAIGSITTYMIFFIQFMPKFTNFQDDKKN